MFDIIRFVAQWLDLRVGHARESAVASIRLGIGSAADTIKGIRLIETRVHAARVQNGQLNEAGIIGWLLTVVWRFDGNFAKGRHQQDKDETDDINHCRE